MSLCGARHPEHPLLFCQRPGNGPQANHEEHTAYYDGEWADFLDWPNEDYAARSNASKRSLLKEIASRIKR